MTQSDTKPGFTAPEVDSVWVGGIGKPRKALIRARSEHTVTFSYFTRGGLGPRQDWLRSQFLARFEPEAALEKAGRG